MLIIMKKCGDERYDIVNLKMSADLVSLSDACEMFTDFLRACGFSFDGRIEIVNGETEVEQDELGEFIIEE